MSLMRQRINLDSHHPEDLEKLSWDDLLYGLSSGGYGSDVMGESDEDFDLYKDSEDDEFEEYREVNAGLLKNLQIQWKKFKGLKDETGKVDVKRLVKGKKKLFSTFRSELIEASMLLADNELKTHVYKLAQSNLIEIKKYENQTGGELPPELAAMKTSLTNILKIMGVLSKVMAETDKVLSKHQSNPFANTKSVLFHGDPKLTP